MKANYQRRLPTVLNKAKQDERIIDGVELMSLEPSDHPVDGGIEILCISQRRNRKIDIGVTHDTLCQFAVVPLEDSGSENGMFTRHRKYHRPKQGGIHGARDTNYEYITINRCVLVQKRLGIHDLLERR